MSDTHAPRLSFRLSAVAFLLGTSLLACGEDTVVDNSEVADPATQPLTDLDALFDGTPDNASIPEDGKFDAVYPAQFDVTDTLTPVRSQGGRGTCSIFASIALMEQLYRAEGTIQDPDFSEQFLQWSTKIELGIFPNTAGSNAGRNLDAIHRFGVVTEDIYPYESSQWGASDDDACSGDNQPTRCYTNGDPSDEVLDAQRWHLPDGRYVNCRPNSVKAYMTEKNVGVTASVEFFYQAWNHGGSELQVSSEYSRNGYVPFPSDEDIADSEQRPAGHAFLLVGWDDELEVPLLDAQGNPRIDDNGEPIVERGFYLFKNSWGTSRFGVNNPFGAGLGWISQRYIEEYGSCYSSAIPEVVEIAEICNNTIDDDGNGDIDCDDDACAELEECRAPDSRNVGPGGDIPDNDVTGMESNLALTHEGIVSVAYVTVDIDHTYRGDLRVGLIGPNNEEIILHEREGGSEDGLKTTFRTEAFNGVPAAGMWTLTVADLAAQDTGRLNSWAIELELGGALVEICDDEIDNDDDGDIDCDDSDCAASAACGADTTVRFESEATFPLDIPDGESAVDDILETSGVGAIGAISVDVEITHPNRGDLTVTLENSNGDVILFDQEDGDADDLVRTFTPTEFIGDDMADLWLLTVTDGANLDAGTLDYWAIELTPAE